MTTGLDYQRRELKLPVSRFGIKGLEMGYETLKGRHATYNVPFSAHARAFGGLRTRTALDAQGTSRTTQCAVRSATTRSQSSILFISAVTQLTSATVREEPLPGCSPLLDKVPICSGCFILKIDAPSRHRALPQAYDVVRIYGSSQLPGPPNR
jgi:hypothetical protein